MATTRAQAVPRNPPAPAPVPGSFAVQFRFRDPLVTTFNKPLILSGDRSDTSVVVLQAPTSMRHLLSQLNAHCRSPRQFCEDDRETALIMAGSNVDSVVVMWDYKWSEDEDTSGNAKEYLSGLTEINESNFDGTMILLKERKGQDVLLLKARRETRHSSYVRSTSYELGRSAGVTSNDFDQYGGLTYAEE